MYIVPTQVDGGGLKKSTAQSCRLTNLVRIFINLYTMCVLIKYYLQQTEREDKLENTIHELEAAKSELSIRAENAERQIQVLDENIVKLESTYLVDIYSKTCIVIEELILCSAAQVCVCANYILI